MWCSLCRTDVSVRTTGHAGGLLCSRCGHDLRSSARPNDAIQQAREILERWNSSDLFERISRTESMDSLHTRIDAAKKPDVSPETAPLPETGDIIRDADQEHETDTTLPVIEIVATRKTADAVQLSELTHTDVLSVTTVTNAKVTGEGITSELQRVMDFARAHNADPMCLTEDNASHADTSVNAVLEVFDVTEFKQSLQPASDAGGAVADFEPSPPKPAETANVSEPASAVEPKMILRSPMRRPLLHRRFQLERPATTSSTGFENVNRNLRVDQPGGNKDLPEAVAAQQAASNASSVAPETRIVSNSPMPGRRTRIDGPESVDDVTGTDGRRGRTQTLPKHRYIDDAHDSAMRGPHFEITTPRRSNLTSVTGQFLAYLGVLGLTIGTAMVIYGHFGGYSEYTPTGWLVTTVAQMLLFLGVINLVSGGIEQNNDDVSRRINTLGQQLLRIEQVTADALKGTKLSPRLYDNSNADSEETSRETAGVNRE